MHDVYKYYISTWGIGSLTTPKVSIIIVTGKRKQYLLDAIKSVIYQTIERDSFEVILMKEFSDEPLEDLIRSYGVRIFSTRSNDIGEAYYLGAKMAQGELISFLDDDDMFLPGKIEFVIQSFESNRNLGYLHNHRVLYNEENQKLFYMSSERKSLLITNKEKTMGVLRYLHKTDAYSNLSCVSVRKPLLFEKLDLRRMLGHTDDFIFYLAFDSGYDLMFDSFQGTRYLVRNMYDVTTNLEAFRTHSLSESKRKLLTNMYVAQMCENPFARLSAQSDMLSELVYSRLVNLSIDLRTILDLFLCTIRTRIRVKGRLFLVLLSIITLLGPRLTGIWVLKFWFTSIRQSVINSVSH